MGRGGTTTWLVRRGKAGFRHFDTVIVDKTQGEIMNRYPKRIDEMIIRN